jgi:hypothetical protein
MSSDAVQSLLVIVGGLPSQVRQRGGEVHSMFTCSAGNLQNCSGLGQNPSQDSQDRITVARNGR